MDDTQAAAVEKLPWTDARVEELKRLWTEGLSASQIARLLGAGATRNAVIGKLHRLGLSGRVMPARPATPRPRRQRMPSHPSRPGILPTHGAAALKAELTPQRMLMLEPEPQPIRLLEAPEGERVTILMLSDKTCRWPIGDPGTEDFCFCGRAPKTGMPYCEHHARVAYQPLHDRRRVKQG
jgi:GcrA cell cycle regulator